MGPGSTILACAGTRGLNPETTLSPQKPPRKILLATELRFLHRVKVVKKEGFFDYLSACEKRILDFLRQSRASALFKPPVLRQAVRTYIRRPAKRLRPAVLLMAAGCTGTSAGERSAVPAAAGVELFHTWTLIHDDLIDNDTMRRGKPTAHVEAAETARNRLSIPYRHAVRFGRDIAMLAGDVQHGWAVAAFADAAIESGVDPAVILRIIRCLQSSVLAGLIRGQTLDILYGLTRGANVKRLSERAIEAMLRLKTGMLYEFAGWAGAVIGSGTYVPMEMKQPRSATERTVTAIRSFAGHCGTAFQIQDDILGVVGDERHLGKSVGSDVREGKQTLIVHEALKNANSAERRRILVTLGNRKASAGDIREVAAILQSLGGVSRANDRARYYVAKALNHLADIPESSYKDLLRSWSDFMIHREF